MVALLSSECGHLLFCFIIILLQIVNTADVYVIRRVDATGGTIKGFPPKFGGLFVRHMALKPSECRLNEFWIIRV